jgi:positive regulator of sigma E activity
MKRRGKVIRLDGDRALVSLESSEDCSRCAAKHACMTMSGGRERTGECWVRNPAGADIGQMVEIEMAPSASLWIIASTFMVPVISLALGYLVMMGRSDGLRAAGAGIGLVAGILISIVVNRKFSGSDRFTLSISRTVGMPDLRHEEDGGAEHDPEGGDR